MFARRCFILLACVGASQAFTLPRAMVPTARVQASTTRGGRAPLGLRMAGEAGDTIDFGKVGFDEATQLSGMVFQPEQGTSDPESRCRVDWDVRCEKALNDHINVEYTASYAYHSLFAYFNRDTVALKGFAAFMDAQSKEERGHAHEFMEYQNARGGQVVLKPVAVPEMQFSRVDGTSDALYAMELALQLEKFVYRKLKALHVLGEECNDPEFCDKIEQYLGEQVDAIKSMAEYVAQIRRVGTGHGVWHMDKDMMDAAA